MDNIVMAIGCLLVAGLLIYLASWIVCEITMELIQAARDFYRRIQRWQEDRREQVELERARDQAELDLKHWQEFDQVNNRLQAELAMKTDAKTQSKLDAPREELERYYMFNAEFLEDHPWEMLLAFMNIEMNEDKPLVERWAACHRMVAELKPMVEAGKNRQRRDLAARDSRERREVTIDREIAALNERIEQLRDSPMDPDTIDNEILGIHAEIRRLESERNDLQTRTNHA